MISQIKHKVKGSLQIDRGIYTVRARVYNPVTGKLQQKAKSTGLAAKGNKRRAEEMMKQIIADWERGLDKIIPQLESNCHRTKSMRGKLMILSR